MPTLYRPQWELKINGFDVSATIAPYLISISIEETFDTSFSPTKLELVFHAKYQRSLAWQNKDTITVKLWWESFPGFIYDSPTFYVDYVDDIKDDGQTFRISAMAADPNLGFSYGAGELSYTNTTVQSAINSFASSFGLSVSSNILPNVFLGRFYNVFSTPPPALTVCEIQFDSYADLLKHICETYGFFGSLTGTTVRLWRIESAFTNYPRFTMPSIAEVSSFNAKQSFNPLYKEYTANYSNGGVLASGFVNPPMSAQLNNRIFNIDSEDAYYNLASASARLNAAYYLDMVAGFETTITTSALPEMKAGAIFLLDATYGIHEGFYRCTKVRHLVGQDGWNTEVTGFPLNITEDNQAAFKVGYLGRTSIPNDPSPIVVSTNLKGNLSSLTGTQLDTFAKSINANYSQNLGATFITEGNKSGNQIRADIAFCMALVITRNFTFPPLMSVNNPGGLLNAGGTAPANFTSWLLGIRAMIQRLYAYATPGTTPPADPIVDPRYSSVTRGSATTLFALTGQWNSNPDLDYMVSVKLRLLYEFHNPNRQVDVI